jgi:hypothetical protein
LTKRGEEESWPGGSLWHTKNRAGGREGKKEDEWGYNYIYQKRNGLGFYACSIMMSPSSPSSPVKIQVERREREKRILFDQEGVRYKTKGIPKMTNATPHL